MACHRCRQCMICLNFPFLCVFFSLWFRKRGDLAWNVRVTSQTREVWCAGVSELAVMILCVRWSGCTSALCCMLPGVDRRLSVTLSRMNGMNSWMIYIDPSSSRSLLWNCKLPQMENISQVHNKGLTHLAMLRPQELGRGKLTSDFRELWGSCLPLLDGRCFWLLTRRRLCDTVSSLLPSSHCCICGGKKKHRCRARVRNLSGSGHLQLHQWQYR